MSTVLLIVGLLLFIGLVVAHEFGHFIMARQGGVEVEEFGLGFPPRLLKWRTKKGWLFTINLLPLGGFVKLKGEHDTDTELGSFGAASLGTKTKIMAAGVIMNLLAAFVLLTFLALVGMPQLVDNQYVVKSDATYIQLAQTYTAAAMVESGSPAAGAGIKVDDEIVALGKVPHLTTLSKVNALPALTSKYAGQTVEVAYKHGDSGPVLDRTVTLRTVAEVQNARKEGKQIGYLGVSVYQAQNGLSLVRSTWSAPIIAAGDIGQFTVLTFEGLGRVVAGLSSTVAGSITGNTHARQAGQTKASSQIVGPVGVFYILKNGTVLGYRFVLMIVAVVSLSLAIVNILPLPALDGGRLWLMLFSRLVKRPISADKEEIIHATGFIVLILLVLLITIVDVKRFF